MIKKNIKMFVIIINRKNENLYIKNILIKGHFLKCPIKNI